MKVNTNDNVREHTWWYMWTTFYLTITCDSHLWWPCGGKPYEESNKSSNSTTWFKKKNAINLLSALCKYSCFFLSHTSVITSLTSHIYRHFVNYILYRVVFHQAWCFGQWSVTIQYIKRIPCHNYGSIIINTTHHMNWFSNTKQWCTTQKIQ